MGHKSDYFRADDLSGPSDDDDDDDDDDVNDDDNDDDHDDDDNNRSPVVASGIDSIKSLWEELITKTIP